RSARSSSCSGRSASRRWPARARSPSPAGPRRGSGASRRSWASRGAVPARRATIRRSSGSPTNRRRESAIMPARIFYDQDADLGLLRNKKVAIIGYGSQGHAHALNLKDSGQDVVVGLYEGSKSWARAERDGLKVMTVKDATHAGDVIMILLPDQT